MKILTKGSYLGSQTDALVYRNIILSKTEYRQKEDQNWHCHENAFFAYFLKGGNKEFRKGDEIKCSAGTLLFYKAGELHCNKDYIFGSRIFHFEIENNWFIENKLNWGNIPHGDEMVKKAQAYMETKLDEKISVEHLDRKSTRLNSSH